MANVIINEFRKYFDRLTATNPICVALGDTFTSGSNLFVIIEPSTATKCLTITPYSGSSPRADRLKYESSVQIRLKIRDRQKGIRTMQEIINTIHCNTNVCASANSKCFAVQSSPIVLEMYEGGQYLAYISNFIIKHTKL